MKRDDVVDAYEWLSNTAYALFAAHAEVAQAEEIYTDAKMTILATVDAKTLGTNAEQREANLHAQCLTQIQAVRQAQAKERIMRYDYEKARRSLDRLHDLMRFLMPPTQRVAGPYDATAEEIPPELNTDAAELALLPF